MFARNFVQVEQAWPQCVLKLTTLVYTVSRKRHHHHHYHVAPPNPDTERTQYLLIFCSLCQVKSGVDFSGTLLAERRQLKGHRLSQSVTRLQLELGRLGRNLLEVSAQIWQKPVKEGKHQPLLEGVRAWLRRGTHTRTHAGTRRNTHTRILMTQSHHLVANMQTTPLVVSDVRRITKYESYAARALTYIIFFKSISMYFISTFSSFVSVRRS